MPKKPKMSEKKAPSRIEVIPLTEDKPRAIVLLRNLLLNFPFNCSHQRFEVFRYDYSLSPYTAQFWAILIRQMEKKGYFNVNLISPQDLSRFREILIQFNSFGRLEPFAAELMCEALIQNVFGQWPSTHTNGYYREDPKFVIFRDFLLLIYSLLLPGGKNWKEYLSDPQNSGGSFSHLFSTRIKQLDPNWIFANKALSKEIEKQYLHQLPPEEKKRLILGLANFFLQDQQQEREFISQNLDAIRKKEESTQIPWEYRTIGSKIYEALKDEVDEAEKKQQQPTRNIKFPRNYDLIHYRKEFDSRSTSGRDTPIDFGLPPNIFCNPHYEIQGSGERYEFEWIVDVVHTPESLVKEINKILSLFFGRGDFQLGGDGVLRYLGSSEESHQAQLMIQAFVDKNLEKLLPLVDKVLESLEKAQWNDVARNSRTLLEDFIRGVLDKKKISYDTKATLEPLIQLLRDNIKVIFDFPKWCTSDPTRDVDHLLQGMKIVGKLTNPPSHTGKKQLQESEAIQIKNMVFMFMITLAGFFA